ncbi:Uncharacterised protein [[Actinobacillus] rossii]|uniref:Uncharacterized protein n=1 Tax=[Actinobacillus] rossii TaxID=123820 RepID=A0A380TYX2_9PAST|nr:Uncharacterised protein [[Actinobacillus] rossii]
MLSWLLTSILFYIYVFTHYLFIPLKYENWFLSSFFLMSITYIFISCLKRKRHERTLIFYCVFIYFILIFIHLIGFFLIKLYFPGHELFHYNFETILYNAIGIPIGIMIYWLKTKI